MRILDTGAKLEPPVAVLLGGEPSGAGTVQSGRLRVFTATLNVPKLVNEFEVVHVDGVAAYATEVLADGVPLPASLSLDPDRYWLNVRGPVCVYAWNERRRILRLLPDFLGGAMIFSYSSGGHRAVSSSLTALVKIVSELRLPLTKSSDFLVELLASEGGGLSNGTSWTEIEVLPSFSYVEMTDDGVKIVAYTDLEKFFAQKEDVAAATERIAHDLTSNAVAMASVSGTKTAHLSAGADSRLTLAALSHAGLAKEFVYYCAGNAVTEEHLIAEHAAAALGVTMTNHAGTTIARAFIGPIADSLATLHASAGMKSVGPHQGYVRTDGVILSGIFGEQYRSFYSRLFPVSQAVTGQAFLQQTWVPLLIDREIGILQQEVVEKFARSVDEHLLSARRSGIREDAVGDYLYAVGRNRYFGAESLMATSRYTKQGSLLYSTAGLSASLQLPLEERSDGLLMYELFQVLEPRLLAVPFDTEKFGQSVADRGYKNRKFDRHHPRPPVEYDGRKNGAVESVQMSLVRQVAVTNEHTARARRIGGLKNWQVANEAEARLAVRRHISRDGERLEGTFDIDRLRALVSRPANTRSAIRLVNRLALYLQWYMT